MLDIVYAYFVTELFWSVLRPSAPILCMLTFRTVWNVCHYMLMLGPKYEIGSIRLLEEIKQRIQLHTSIIFLSCHGFLCRFHYFLQNGSGSVNFLLQTMLLLLLLFCSCIRVDFWKEMTLAISFSAYFWYFSDSLVLMI